MTNLADLLSRAAAEHPSRIAIKLDYEHPDVRLAAVIGIPHDELGAAIKREITPPAALTKAEPGAARDRRARSRQ